MNKRAKILKQVNRQFSPGLPEWIGDSAGLVVFFIIAYVVTVFIFGLGK